MMITPNTIIEYQDDLIFAACEFRWSKGDKFALIEAIAICAANDLKYPKWVRSQIDVAMTGIFEAVFPGIQLQGGRQGLGISSLPDVPELLEMKTQFEASVKEASKLISFKLDRRNIVESHIKAVRDYNLGELIELFADFEYKPIPKFSPVTKIKKELEISLNLSKSVWQERVRADEEFGPINGRLIRISLIEPICRMATFDVIDDAWDAYKEFFLADRIAKYEDDHDINLSE